MNVSDVITRHVGDGNARGVVQRLLRRLRFARDSAEVVAIRSCERGTDGIRGCEKKFGDEALIIVCGRQKCVDGRHRL
jgi:hypothetical protein